MVIIEICILCLPNCDNPLWWWASSQRMVTRKSGAGREARRGRHAESEQREIRNDWRLIFHFSSPRIPYLRAQIWYRICMYSVWCQWQLLYSRILSSSFFEKKPNLLIRTWKAYVSYFLLSSSFLFRPKPNRRCKAASGRATSLKSRNHHGGGPANRWSR